MRWILEAQFSYIHTLFQYFLYDLALNSDEIDRNLNRLLDFWQGNIELYHKQELLSQYTSIDVSYQSGSVYCTLVRKDRKGRSQPAIFQVTIKDTLLSFK